MLRRLVDSLRVEAREAGSNIEKAGSKIEEEQTPEKSKLVKDTSFENDMEAFENKLDLGLTCLVLAGLEDSLTSDMQKRAQALAIAVRPPLGSAPLSKDVKAKIKKQRLAVRDALKSMVSNGIPNVDTQALTQNTDFCTKLRATLMNRTADLVKQGYLGGFTIDEEVKPESLGGFTQDQKIIDVKPVLKTNLKTKPEKMSKQKPAVEEDLDSLLTEFGIILTQEKTGKGKNKKSVKH